MRQDPVLTDVEVLRPGRINTYRELTQKAKKDDHYDMVAYSSTREALLREAYKLFPGYARDFLPTRLGNALRAAERYGYERYCLDTQVLWYELGAVTPEPLSQDLDSVRGMVDFFVSAATLSVIYALITASVATAKTDWVFAVCALVGVVLSRLSYLRAARGVGAIAKTQQAIVNVSRGKLAGLFGLAVPADMHDEKEMWSALVAFVRDGTADDQDPLQAWRKPATVEGKDDNDGFVTVRASVSHPRRRQPHG